MKGKKEKKTRPGKKDVMGWESSNIKNKIDKKEE